VAGIPKLAGKGLLAVGAAGSLELAGAAPSAQSILSVSLSNTPTPFRGGLLNTLPILYQFGLYQFGLATDGSGGWLTPWASWPPGIPPDTVPSYQDVVADAAAIRGASIGNLLAGLQR
jgi:hypothetical protein